MRWWIWVILGFILVAAVSVTLVDLYHGWQPWVAMHTGSASGNESNGYYAYWSGFGSVFPWSMEMVFGIFLFTYHNWRHKNCHQHGCWRVGSHPVGEYSVCKRHFEEASGHKVTAEHLKLAHHLHSRKKLRDAGYHHEDGA